MWRKLFDLKGYGRAVSNSNRFGFSQRGNLRGTKILNWFIARKFVVAYIADAACYISTSDFPGSSRISLLYASSPLV
jgi:hypothetical protein